MARAQVIEVCKVWRFTSLADILEREVLKALLPGRAHLGDDRALQAALYPVQGCQDRRAMWLKRQKVLSEKLLKRSSRCPR